MYIHVHVHEYCHVTRFCRSVHTAHGVTTYSLHPGAIMTELQRHLKDDSVLGWLWAAGEYVTFVFQKDVAHGAATQICCAVDPALGAVSGKYYR